MTELGDAFKDLADTHLGATPPVEAIFRRAEKRKKRRRSLAGGGGILVIATVVALVALFSSDKGQPQRERVHVYPTATSPVATTTPPPVTSPPTTLPAPHPVAGSTPHDYKDMRLWVPTGWTTAVGQNCTTGDDVVYFPNALQATACSSDDYVIVVTEPATIPPSATGTVINGTKVWSVPAGTATDWYVPSLGVKLVIGGPAGAAVADTIEASAYDHLLHDALPVAVPKSYGQFDYEPYGIYVPTNWTNYQTQAGPPPTINVCYPLMFAKGTLYFGGTHNDAVTCPRTPDPQPATGGGVWLASETSALTPGAQRTLEIHSLEVSISPGPGGDTALVQVGTPATGYLHMLLGLGSDPLVAEQVISSVMTTPTPYRP